jgi:PAS domain S-box-containing protein
MIGGSDGPASDAAGADPVRSDPDQAGQLLFRAFEAEPDAAAIVRLEGWRLLVVNDAFVELTGHAASEAIGRTLEELSLWAHPADGASLVTHARDAGTAGPLPLELRKRSGETQTLETSAARANVGPQGYVVIIWRGVTSPSDPDD